MAGHKKSAAAKVNAPAPSAPTSDDKSEHQRATEFVASHPVTIRLRAFGISEAQLDATGFCGRRDPGHFDVWAFRPGFDGPVEALMLAKAYSALKWLVVDNPPGSPDKDAGWRLVQDVETAPLVASARRTREQRATTTARGIAARTKYTVEDHAKWRAFAAQKPGFARHSKRRQAELIAAEFNLPEAAVETIRRKL